MGKSKRFNVPPGFTFVGVTAGVLIGLFALLFAVYQDIRSEIRYGDEMTTQTVGKEIDLLEDKLHGHQHHPNSGLPHFYSVPSGPQ